MSDLIDQIDALLALNAKGAVSHPVPRLAVELLERAIAELSRRSASNTGGVEVKAKTDRDMRDGMDCNWPECGCCHDSKCSDAPSLAAEAEPVAQGSCASCNGTGDTGGNPSYGMCPDCDGTGKFPPAHPSSSVSAEVTVQVATAIESARTLLFGLGLWSGEEYARLTAALAALNGGRENG